jgi:hypothetical protein
MCVVWSCCLKTISENKNALFVFFVFPANKISEKYRLSKNETVAQIMTVFVVLKQIKLCMLKFRYRSNIYSQIIHRLLRLF